jgi:Flp pilus assembly protein TadD
MEEKGFRLPACVALSLALIVLGLTACSTPRIIVLNDPLTAGEHVDLGAAYEQKGLLDQAKKEYLKALDIQDTWAVPYFNLGNVAYGQRDLKAAEGYYRKALKLDPENPDIMNNLASLLHDTGRNEEAKVLIDKALATSHKAQYLDTKQKITGPQGQQ